MPIIGQASFAEADVASASTCDIGATDEIFVNVTGTTTITSFGSGAKKLRFIKFAAALTLTHNADSLILPGGANITTAAGDAAIASSDEDGNWKVRHYARAAETVGTKAPLASPAFTGAPTAPTASQGTNSVQIATTAFVVAAINAVINAAPGALDTLDELAAALGDDANYAATVTAALAAKAPLASPALTGNPTAPTQSAGNNSTRIATTAYVRGEISALHAREVLTADRTYYVRSDGSDSNDGLSNTSGGAFATPQKAMDVAAALDISIYNVAINVGAGTYGQLTLKSPVGAGSVSFVGDETTPANVTLAGTFGLYGPAVGSFVIAGFKLASTASRDAFVTAGDVTLRNCEYAGTSNYRMHCTGPGKITCAGTNNKISGGGLGMFFTDAAGKIFLNNTTWTLTANVTYSVAFVVTRSLGYLEVASTTFTLGAFAVTGPRYSVATNSVVAGTSAGASYFPGSTAGSTATGGQYT